MLSPAIHAAEPHPRAKDLNPVSWQPAPNHAPVVLVSDGQPKATICVMGARSATLNAAVADLQQFVEKATGAKLPIENGKITDVAIVVGNCEAAAAVGLVGKEMPVEGFAIKTSENRVYIAGNDEPVPDGTVNSEGTAWGVYDFLERFVGVRWYYPGEIGMSFTPPLSKSGPGGGATPPLPKGGPGGVLSVPPAWLTDAPVFRKREIWPPVSNPWNGTGTQLIPLHRFLRSGDSWPRRLVVHSPDWNRVADYKQDRPEVFQLRSDGTRDFSMLCYGSPRTLATYLENIERHAKGEKPVHLGIVGKTITVSPADAEIACYCEHCRKLWNADGGQYGAASKIVAKFTADLGREVKQRWPDLNILYLPYLNYTLAPDGIELGGIEFPDNVEVQLCGMPGLAQYKEPAIAESEQQTIDRWVKLTGRKIQNWHYSCWPEDRTVACYLFPHTIRDFYQRNREKTVGSFINGTTDHWPRQHLSLYCWLKVLWNPEFDVDAAIDEYCARMYGPAASTMRQLVQMQIDGWEKSRWPSERLSPKAVHETSFPLKDVEQMESLLAKARAEAAGNELVLKRLDYYASSFKEFFLRSKEYASGGGLQPLLIQKVGESPKLDGKLDDEVWKRATANSFVRGWDRKQREPTYATSVRGVWTAEGVTFGFQMQEPTPERLERNIKGHDDSLAWWDDNIELLFDVTGKNEGEYYHFIVNPNNAVADAKGKDFSRNFESVKTAVHVGEKSWSMEVYLPYAAFEEAARPATGIAWHGSFTRHRVADKGLSPKFQSFPGSEREYQRMNTTYAVPSNNLADFAPLKFVE